jgi:hypothetical protein
MKMPRLAIAVSCLVLLGAEGEEPKSAVETTACLQRNVPEVDHVRAVRFVTRDRMGSDKVTVVKLYSRREADGSRQVLLRFSEPDYLEGAAFLMLEQDGVTEMYVKTSEEEKAKMVSSPSRATSLFGTDFSYEDFERVQAFNRPGAQQRMEDDTIGGRSVYVVETRPAQPKESAYERVITYIDKETCLALRMEFYEADWRLRKLFTVNPHRVTQKDSVWIPQMSMIRDLRDYTSTQIFVDSTEQEALPGEMFTVAGLESSSR